MSQSCDRLTAWRSMPQCIWQATGLFHHHIPHLAHILSNSRQDGAEHGASGRRRQSANRPTGKYPRLLEVASGCWEARSLRPGQPGPEQAMRSLSRTCRDRAGAFLGSEQLLLAATAVAVHSKSLESLITRDDTLRRRAAPTSCASRQLSPMPSSGRGPRNGSRYKVGKDIRRPPRHWRRTAPLAAWLFGRGAKGLDAHQYR